jgi:hypothetical protein
MRKRCNKAVKDKLKTLSTMLETGSLQTMALKEIEKISKAIYEDDCDDQVEWSTEYPLTEEEYSKKVANYIKMFIPMGILKHISK